MSASPWHSRVRQVHRWVSVVFTGTVVANFAVMAAWGQDPSLLWVSMLPLPPLFLLLFTGLYLFVLPYLARTAPPRVG